MTKKQDENGEGPDASAGDMQSRALPRDVHEANLKDLLAQIYDAAQGSFDDARHLGHDRDTQVEVFLQAAVLSKAYAQLLNFRNRHRKALKEER